MTGTSENDISSYGGEIHDGQHHAPSSSAEDLAEDTESNSEGDLILEDNLTDAVTQYVQENLNATPNGDDSSAQDLVSDGDDFSSTEEGPADDARVYAESGDIDMSLVQSFLDAFGRKVMP